MEESLYENLSFLKSIVETAPLPIAVYEGEELKIVLANKAMIETWGKGNDVIGKYYTEILPELESQKVFSQAKSVIRTGIPHHEKNCRIELIIDGVLKTHFFNYNFTPVKDSSGKTYAVMNTGADVTGITITQQQAGDTEERLRLAVESAELGLYEVDFSTNNISTSANFNAIWGVQGNVSRDDIIRKIHPDDLPLREKAHQEAILSGNLHYEARIIPKPNSIRWIRIRGKIIFDTSRNPLTLLGITQDITEQKEFSEELSKLVTERTYELKKSNEELLHFTNIVSHDLKEPLRKINIFNNLLKNDLGSLVNEKNIPYFDKVQHSTQRMTSIIEGVLSYSTINRGGSPVEQIDLNSLIENIKIDLELIIHEKQAVVEHDSLPDIEGATILIHQLLYNLIHNALKFSTAGTVPRVTISNSVIAVEDSNFIRLSIKDNGIGFDQEYAQRIFNAFERLHSKDVFEGTGLGLSLCKKIAERHNGTIEAIGNKNNGAEFVVLLPLRQTTDRI